MIFRRRLLCLCTIAICVVLCLSVLLKRSLFPVTNNIRESENNESYFTDSGPQLPKEKASGRMKGNSSSAGRRVTAQKNKSQTSTSDKVPNASSSIEMPIRFPDGPLVPQPPEVPDPVKLTQLFFEEFDKDPSVIGICQNPDTGRVYPLYPNTVYVKRRESV